MKLFRIAALFLAATLLAQKADDGSVKGVVLDQSTSHPIEYVTITLRSKATSEVVRTGVTDSKGGFVLEKVPLGEYQLVYSPLGADQVQTSSVTVDVQHRSIDLGRLMVAS